MNSFFHQHSYSIVKMFVNQFAISIFGMVLAMATTAANNDVLTIIVSIFSILFYLFLIYTMTWEIGATDRISVDVGKKTYRPHTGLLLSLFANVPNLIIAILYAIAYPFMATPGWAANLNAVLNVISAIIEGMYRGITSVIILPSGHPLMHYWWTYFLMILPALITAWLAYFMGFKNIRILAQYFNKSNQSNNK